MAIQCKDLPFKISFIIGNNGLAKEVRLFYKSEEDLYQVSPSIEILENLSLEVHFECDDVQAKLYIEGLDEIVSKVVEEEDGQPFISPTSAPIVLFNVNDYPLIPGYYQLIVEVKEEFYYAIVNVKPMHISQTAWEVMRDELESVLPGLAMDLVFRNLGFNKAFGVEVPLPPYNLFAFLIINQNFSKVISALTDLMTKINFRLRKKYQEKPIASGAVIDDISLRHKLTRPGKSEIIMSPVKSLDYDLQENRWIKQIVFFITRLLEDFLRALEQYRNEMQKEINELECYGMSSSNQRERKKRTIMDMDVFYRKAKKMSVALRMIENAPWYSSISPLRSGNVPAVLFMDSRYRILYNLYQQIKRQDITVSLDKTYAYQWKCTYKLYEIWCYIQICKTLNDLGFNLCGGWLSDIGSDLETVLVPAISSGTYAEFLKENIMVRVSYDSKIPYMIDETDHDSNPMYIGGSHNRPDIKLDIYIDRIYSGSLLMDVKYRKPSNFWDAEKLRTHQRTKEMNQLICYSLESLSSHLYGNNQSDIRPVSEVWVLYPDKVNIYNNKFFPDHRIRFICLSPNSLNILEELLESRINDIQNKAALHK